MFFYSKGFNHHPKGVHDFQGRYMVHFCSPLWKTSLVSFLAPGIYLRIFVCSMAILGQPHPTKRLWVHAFFMALMAIWKSKLMFFNRFSMLGFQVLVLVSVLSAP